MKYIPYPRIVTAPDGSRVTVLTADQEAQVMGPVQAPVTDTPPDEAPAEPEPEPEPEAPVKRPGRPRRSIR